ncbi:unannotated protein [freshwater metagenome]|uniref:Unannotated protein n=1 Tax=freshwater metagenome TaxID=449393 RepID=A0A6J7CK69_9ZZZZ
MRRSAEESLADFTRVTDALSEVVWQRDMTLGTLIYASQGIERLLGISMSELGSDASAIDALIAPEDIDRVEAARDPRGREWSVEYRLRPRDGTELWVVERATVAKVRGEVDRVVGTLTNITDQKVAEVREHEQRVIIEAVYRAPFMGIAIVDEQSRVTQANDYFCELLGYAPGSVDGMPLAAFGYVEDDLAAGPSSDAIPLMSGLNTRLLLCRDGSRRWADVERRALVGLGGDSGTAMFVVRDITQLREQTEELSRRATTDAATGLLNREHFQHTLARQIVSGDQKGSSVALVWVDIDHFKEVNDRHGHAAGDEVLRRSAERIEAAVRSNDIVGRLGGDEFGVILTRFEGAAELETVLGRILSALRQPIAIGEAEIVVSGSLGVAVYPEDGVAPDTLMRSADAAMYAIKKRRGDGFEYFRPELTREAEARSSMREDIASAIRDERFTLFYQPILDATTGALWGVEALLRWRRNGDVVAAEHFIDFCESSGQIRDLAPLTFALLRGDLDALRRSGTEIGRACVNVSVSQLEDKTFTELMNWWPSPTGLAGVVMEITESVFLPDHHRAIETLHHLTHLGAEISVDDFGSGYSNLLLLESLAPTCIKLDKSFLASRALAGRGDELSSAAIKMAHSLQSIVVAEGIETDEQLASVRGLGANLVQGYAMATPMPRDDLVAWIRERKREPAGR